MPERKLETRRLVGSVEVRKHEDGQRHLEGIAVPYNTLSEDLGGFREQVASGAFERSLKDGDVRALLNHDTGRVLGRMSAGTLELRDEKDGLHFSVALPQTSYAEDLVVSAERGDIDGMSFGFVADHDEWDESGDEIIRTIRGAELIEVSPVTFPAYTDTTLALRSMEHWKARQGQPLQIRRNRLSVAERSLRLNRRTP